MSSEDLESMLKNRDSNLLKTQYNNNNDITNSINYSEKLKSDKSATLFDFIKMIDKLVTLTMKDLNVKFIPDEGKHIFMSSDNKLDNPTITYKINSRKPKNELKPRVREQIAENINGKIDRLGEVYGQKFKCIVQFNIFASVYETAELVMEIFEELMIKYAGFFKKNGVGEIIFDNQFTDNAYDSMRQTLSVRNITYYVEIEKLTVIMKESIKSIENFLI